MWWVLSEWIYLYSYRPLLLNMKDCLHVFSYYNYVEHFQYQVNYLYRSSESGSRRERTGMSAAQKLHRLQPKWEPFIKHSELEKYFQLTHYQTLYDTEHLFWHIIMYGNTAACNIHTHSHDCLKKNCHLLFHINETTIEPTCGLTTKIWYDFKLLNMSQKQL